MPRFEKPPSYQQVFKHAMAKGVDFWTRIRTTEANRLVLEANEKGWNWKECRYRAGQAKLAPDDFWAMVKFSRQTERKSTPILDVRGRPFTYRLPPIAHETLHLVDKQMAGTIGALSPQLDDEGSRRRFLIRSLREEAISSAIYEGAHTTRDAAREMIRSNRDPKTEGERMVWNNFQTIQFLNNCKNDALTEILLLDVQRKLTDQTLKKPDAAGRYRLPDEDISVVDDRTGERVHTPVAAHELPVRMRKLCEYANQTERTGEFVHPVIRAILLHFWLAYDHPFYDGNGRTARALFYWSMLKQGYWMTEFLSISTVIAGQSIQYSHAFMDTERDENDLTYFILYHLRVIERSIREFTEYLEEKQKEAAGPARSFLERYNPRQRAILMRALEQPATIFTFQSHAGSHGIQLATARADLLELEKLKLLKGNRKGRRFEFVPAPDIHERLKKLSAQ